MKEKANNQTTTIITNYIIAKNIMCEKYMKMKTKQNKKIQLNPNPNQQPNMDVNMNGGSDGLFSPFFGLFDYINTHVMYLNNSKFFAGIVMILLNVGSKFISIQFSKSTEEYMKYTLSKQILVFAMAWMGTRDIYTALGLTAVFTILSEHLFNEESSLCIVPEKYRILHKLIDTNNDGLVSDTEISSAIAVLEKAKREKQRLQQQQAFENFNYERDE